MEDVAGVMVEGESVTIVEESAGGRGFFNGDAPHLPLSFGLFQEYEVVAMHPQGYVQCACKGCDA